MIIFPNCKINLGLSIINKRNDGYHNLETIFYPLSVTDALEIIPFKNEAISANNEPTSSVRFTCSGLPVNGSNEDNLCIKAWRLLKADFPALPSLQMHLHKAIPMGAGLGGGSADGAYVLRLMNNLFHLNIPATGLISYAVKLGSDCPFFIINKPCFAYSRGELMEPVALDLSGYRIVLKHSELSINTGWAFSQLNVQVYDDLKKPSDNLKEIIKLPVRDWKNLLINDFERPVFEKYPSIKLLKDQLYDQGALYASMTGSGSTVFGIFNREVV